jgi:hypothetical protein
LVVAIVPVVAVVLVTAQAVALVAIAQVGVAVVVMALEHALNLVLAAIKIVEIALVIHVTHVLAALRILVLHAPQTLVQVVQPALALRNQSQAANVATLAAAKHVSPQSSPFCMESSRFR